MNSLPLFYQENLADQASIFVSSEETRRHVVTVLRMQPGERIRITDGRGLEITSEIIRADKKQLELKKIESIQHSPLKKELVLAISLLKNAARFEWMLEKATEIGITQFYPLLTERTERQHFRGDRLKQILVSASMQSERFHFPVLHEPVSLNQLVQMNFDGNKFIAHCMEGDKKCVYGNEKDSILLIGPEGDFSPAELELALTKGFEAVTLANSRLRTETAGIVGAVLMCQ